MWDAREMEQVGAGKGGDEQGRQIWDLDVLAWVFMKDIWVVTISDSRPRAGRSVGGASLWRSMPSNTSTKRRLPSRRSGVFQLATSLLTSTTSWERFSQRATFPWYSTAFATNPTVCSSRCLPLMHSTLLTMAYLRRSSGASDSP